MLIGRLPFERAARGKSISRVEFGHLVHHFLVGIVDLARPRVEFRRTTEANALAQQLFVAHLRTEEHADAGGEQTVEGIDLKAVAFPAEGRRTVGFAQAGVVEQVACCGAIAAVHISALHTPRRTAARKGQTGVGRSCQSEASAVAAVECRDIAFGLRAHIREGFAIEQDDTAESFGTIAHGLRAFHHIDAAGVVGIQFGRVIHAPLLSLLAHTVVHDEQARAIHAVQHRFGDGGAGLHHAHSFDLFEGGGKGTTEIFLHLGGRERLCGGIARVDDASGLHHGLVEAIGERAERHAQGAVAAHLVGGDVAVDIAHRTHGETVAVEGIFVEEEQTGLVRAPDVSAVAHHGARNGETGVAIGDEQPRCADGLRFGGAQSGGNHHSRTEQQTGEKKFGHESRGNTIGERLRKRRGAAGQRERAFARRGGGGATMRREGKFTPGTVAAEGEMIRGEWRISEGKRPLPAQGRGKGRRNTGCKRRSPRCFRRKDDEIGLFVPKSHFDACEIAEQIVRWRSCATAIDGKGVSTVRRMPTVRPKRARRGAKRRKTAHPSPKSDGEKARMRQKERRGTAMRR